MRTPILSLILTITCAGLAGCEDDAGGTAPKPGDASADAAGDAGTTAAASHRVILFVWDGLRPDSISEQTTPTLAALRQQGVDFTDNHATYPTFTMMNGASFATGHFPEKTGFYGNTLWEKGAKGTNSMGAAVDYQQPVFTEDYAILRSLKAYYQNKLLLVGTLFEAAHKKGLKTAAVGKSGPAFLQDAADESLVLDERLAYPLAFARELQSAGFHLPSTTPLAYPADAGAPATDGPPPSQISETGNPTLIAATRKLKDNFASDPPADDTALTRQHDANEYLMKSFTDFILPIKKPDLSLIWLRNPDASEHDYGPGSASYRRSLRSQDQLLAALLAKLRELGWDRSTDLLVASDHGHSTVSGPLAIFPLRFIVGDTVDPVTGANTRGPGPVVTEAALAAHPESGWSVSGEVRLAELLAGAGKGWKPYDGLDCLYNPILSGIDTDGNRAAPDHTDATACPNKPTFTSGNHKVPADLSDPNSIVIAANGGSDYLYVPDPDATRRTALVKEVVRFLQGRQEVGAIFVASQYGGVPGTLPMTMVRLESTRGTPDVILSYTWDAEARVQGVPGIEYASLTSPASNRGMHGSFSPRDVHNTLLALGPGFKAGFSDGLPTGNVDVAPTVARLLGLDLPETAGRPLLEALATGGRPASDYTSTASVIKPSADAEGLTVTTPMNTPDATVDSYSIELAVKTLTVSDGAQMRSYRYFDQARAARFKKP